MTLAPDHVYRPADGRPAGLGLPCGECGMPEGNRKHEAADIEVNGTTYGARTPPEVVAVLERYRLDRRPGPGTAARLAIEYGDPVSGRSYGRAETGYVGRSTGPSKVPLLVYNARSAGGPWIPDHCIVQIRFARGGGVLYQHPTYWPAAEKVTAR